MEAAARPLVSVTAHTPDEPQLAFQLPEWMRDALCVEYPNLTWFPERGEPMGEARSVCARCLVREECLAYAVDTGQMFGLWGGMSTRERRRLSGHERRGGA